MPVKVAKFGGTSLSDGAQIMKVKSIVESDSDIMVVVPSAPGARRKGDSKVTDLLLAAHAGDMQSLDMAFDRYRQIIDDCGIDSKAWDFEKEAAAIKKRILRGASTAYAASRGEYLNGKIISLVLGWDFADPADLVKFDAKGRLLDEKTNGNLAKALKGRKCVLPGFYGSDLSNRVVTFSRGGSDITGALAARAIEASVYENWTDVSGFFVADPRIVENPMFMGEVSYRELRELSYMGAGVLHEDSIFPVLKANIPINIKNTNRPQDRGTFILPENELTRRQMPITGIAGRKGFTVITVEKSHMNNEVGITRKMLSIFEEQGVSIEHIPSGIDTLSVVVDENRLDGKLKALLDNINIRIEPDTIDINSNMALIATVGHGMVKQRGTAAKLFGALAGAGVNIRMIDQGSSEMNIIIGVENEDFEKAVNAIYRAFVD